MNSAFDLNRLLAFRAVWEHRNVSRAAEALGVSQPTVSHALAALREHFNDRLFVRCSGGVMPTPRAEQLARRVADALSLLERGLDAGDAFEPATMRREFTLVMTDIAVAIILPRILEICRTEAPLVSFRAIQLPTDSELKALREGAADLAIGFSPALRNGLLHASLFRSEYVCIARNGHPRIHQRLTRRDFLRERHAVALAQGTGHFIVEAMLQRLGLMDQVGARVSNFLALPMIVASSEMIATIPRPLAGLMQPLAPVMLHPVPVRMPPLNIDVFWHERLHDDPGTRWLRSLLPRAMQTIFSTGPAGFSAAMADEGIQSGRRRAGLV